MVIRALVSFLFLIVALSCSFGQGYLMLAGGAGEVQGGWSDLPYKWVVDHAENKRIAIISYSSGQTEWIPEYFKSFGALEAKNIIIPDKFTANLQSTYDTLVSYDAIFLKGGDQYIYYNFYKGTKTVEALKYIFDHGGVLSGTSAGTAILSPIVFTAQIASVDPAQALMNINSPQITLADNFLTTLEGRYIFDSHFIERGRFGRLPSFMANWYLKKNELVTGIGVDDHTALCIDKSGIASVYGTAAVSLIYNTNTQKPYDKNSAILKTKSMEIAQLIHGCSINLNNGSKTGLNKYINPPVKEENGRYNLFFSGTDYPSDGALDYFVNDTGNPIDIITIVTGSSLERAIEIKSKFIGFGATKVNIIQALPINYANPEVESSIAEAMKLFVISNLYQDFFNFIKNSNNGEILRARLSSPGMISFFAGDNARFPGKGLVEKYSGSGFASYHGELEFLPGLGLLETSTIMPNAFINNDTYENTVSGLPYAMIVDSARFGLYLTGNSFTEYNYDENNTSYFRNISGNFPLILLENPGTMTGFASHGPYSSSRNVAGFESFKLKYLAVNDTLTTGKNVTVGIPSSPHNENLIIYPNPVHDVLTIDGSHHKYFFNIIDLSGKVIFQDNFIESYRLNLKEYSEGLYLIHIRSGNSKISLTRKFLYLKD